MYKLRMSCIVVQGEYDTVSHSLSILVSESLLINSGSARVTRGADHASGQWEDIRSRHQIPQDLLNCFWSARHWKHLAGGRRGTSCEAAWNIIVRRYVFEHWCFWRSLEASQNQELWICQRRLNPGIMTRHWHCGQSALLPIRARIFFDQVQRFRKCRMKSKPVSRWSATELFCWLFPPTEPEWGLLPRSRSTNSRLTIFIKFSLWRRAHPYLTMSHTGGKQSLN